MNTKLEIGSLIELTGEEWSGEFGDKTSGVWTIKNIDEWGFFSFTAAPDQYWNLSDPDDRDWGWKFVETPDPVNTPTHYQHPSGIEVIEITRHESFLRGNILKYVLRAPYKGNELEDLKKAAKYLAWEIERVENAVPDA